MPVVGALHGIEDRIELGVGDEDYAAALGKVARAPSLPNAYDNGAGRDAYALGKALLGKDIEVVGPELAHAVLVELWTPKGQGRGWRA